MTRSTFAKFHFSSFALWTRKYTWDGAASGRKRETAAAAAAVSR